MLDRNYSISTHRNPPCSKAHWHHVLQASNFWSLTTQHDLLQYVSSKRCHERSKLKPHYWKSTVSLREMPEKTNPLLIKNQEAAFRSHRSKWETNCFLQPGQMDQKNQNNPWAYGPRHHLFFCSNNVTFQVCSSLQIICSVLYLKHIYANISPVCSYKT